MSAWLVFGFDAMQCDAVWFDWRGCCVDGVGLGMESQDGRIFYGRRSDRTLFSADAQTGIGGSMPNKHGHLETGKKGGEETTSTTSNESSTSNNKQKEGEEDQGEGFFPRTHDRDDMTNNTSKQASKRTSKRRKKPTKTTTTTTTERNQRWTF